jgi:hypothetical protein
MQITGSAICKTYDEKEVMNAVEKAVAAAGGFPEKSSPQTESALGCRL